MKVHVTRPVPEEGLERLRARGELSFTLADPPAATPDELCAAVAGVDGILSTLLEPIDERVLQAAGPALRVVSNFAVGFDNIDVPAATQRGVLVTNTPGVLTDATADLAFGLVLAAARRMMEGDKLVRAGRWDGWKPMQLLGGDVTGAVLGIVGAGRIGRALAERSRGFRMRLLYVDVAPCPALDQLGARRVDLDQCLRESDFVSLHVPLTPDTRNLIGARELSLMKSSAYLVNTSRGPVVDEKALLAALRAEQIAGAGLDVYAQEPFITEGLTALSNVVCLPHLGSATVSTRDRMAVIAAQNLLDALDGQRPAHLLNPEVLEDRQS